MKLGDFNVLNIFEKSACMNGQFACENLGYIVQMIPSMRVNDGICDCCDGSDEYTTSVKCLNRCDEMAIRMREEEERMKILTDQGLTKKNELIEQGKQLRKSLEVGYLLVKFFYNLISTISKGKTGATQIKQTKC